VLERLMGTRWYDAARLPNVVLRYRVISILPAAAGALIDSRVAGCLNTSTLSASIAVYHPQAELFGGRSDGKFGVR